MIWLLLFYYYFASFFMLGFSVDDDNNDYLILNIIFVFIIGWLFFPFMLGVTLYNLYKK